MNTTTGIIGAGKLGSSLIKGWLASTEIDNNNILICESNPTVQEAFAGLRFFDQVSALKDCDVIILCVKPADLKGIEEELASLVSDKLLISTVMGASIDYLKQVCGKNTRIVRAMPNIAAAAQQSMTCLASNEDGESRDAAGQLFRTIGQVEWIAESLMDAATVMTGSGVAFALRYLRAMMQAGIAAGFDAKTAAMISAQVMNSATSLYFENQEHFEALIDKVTTPAGCTIEGLFAMEERGFSSAVHSGVGSAIERIRRGK